MNPVKLTLPERTDAKGSRQLLEQGIPVLPMPVDEIRHLRLVQDDRIIPAEIQIESTDAAGSVTWIMLNAEIEIPYADASNFSIQYKPDSPNEIPKLEISEAPDKITITSQHFTLILGGKDQIQLIQNGKTVIDGALAFSITTDTRSFVAGVRAQKHRAHGFSLEEKSAGRCLVVWKAKIHPDVYRKYDGIDEHRYLECELEIKVFAAKPLIRLKWSITNHFNYQAAMDKYALTLPISKQSRVFGDWIENKFSSHAVIESPGGRFAVTAPFAEDVGPGAGIGIERREWIYDEQDGFSIENANADELPSYGSGTKPAQHYLSADRPPVFKTDYRIAIGGISPPPDGVVISDIPQVHRTILHGMSRTFESSLILNPDEQTISWELDPEYFTVPAQQYSNTGNLPERGDRVTFGDYEQEIIKCAEWLEAKQWKGTLYFGEWWREYDLDRQQGIEESGSGNSSLGVFYHYLRTGDKRFLKSAKRSMLAIFDLTMNKQKNDVGPFMHTRRFLFDRENWHHPRYQRFAGLLRPSHIFCDKRARIKACEIIRWFADKFIDTDGAPLYPATSNPDGPKERLTEAAMSQFCESLILAYHETGDGFFLEKAKSMAGWAVRQMEEYGDILKWMSNWNIQFVQRGLLAVILATGEQQFIDAYIKICRNILKIKPEHAGYKDLVRWEVHFVVYFAWHFAEAHKLTGDDKMLKQFILVLEGELQRQAEDGTFPYVTTFVPRISQWNSYYDQKSAAAYLPVLAARMKAAGISRQEVAREGLADENRINAQWGNVEVTRQIRPRSDSNA